MTTHLNLLFLLCCCFTACVPLTTPQENDTQSLITEPTEHWASYNQSDVALRIIVPPGWETYNTADGIVLNEYVGSSAPDHPMQGFLIHIFSQNLSGFQIPDWAGHNKAWMVLKQVVRNPDYVGQARVSEPVAFDWDGYGAAYYLLNNLDGTVTMLLALDFSDDENMIVCHVSIPEAQSDRIREALPDLLGSLTINGVNINQLALEMLPQPLVFPIGDAPS